MKKDLPAPADWTLEDAQTVVQRDLKRALGDGGYERRETYVVDNDHWHDGKEWVGPRGSAETEQMVLRAVRPQFTPNDAVGEGLDNAEDGLFTVEPRLAFVPVELPEDPESQAALDLQAEADQLEADFAAWWDRVGLWDVIARAYRNSLWATRGPLRLRIPSANLDAGEDGFRLPVGLERRDALDRIRVSAPDPDRARVWEDPDTLDRVGVYLYTEDEEDQAEIWIESGGELRYRIVGKDGSVQEEQRLPAGVRLPMVEVESPLLITDPVLRQQQRLNFFETLAVRVAETAGFPERYFLDVDPPGLWVKGRPVNGDYMDVRDTPTGQEYLVPAPLALGASVANFLQGVLYGREDEPSRTTPSVQFRDPTDPEYVIRLAVHGRRTLLESMKQGHLAGTETAEASGVAYQQARARFEAWLKRRKAAVERAVRDVIVAAGTLAEAMGPGGGSVFERFRVRVDLTVNAGPVLPDQVRSVADLYAAGLRSRSTALAETGVEDVSAEEAALEHEAATSVDRRLERKAKQAEIIQQVGPVASIEGAAKFAEVEPDEAKALASVDLDVVEQ